MHARTEEQRVLHRQSKAVVKKLKPTAVLGWEGRWAEFDIGVGAYELNFDGKTLMLSVPCDCICHSNEINLSLPCRSSLLPVPSHWSLSKAASVLGPVSQARVTCGVQHVAARVL